MLIYSHNLAEKLFGFAQSREFLKYNTDLCGVLDDPNLKIDIDLAIDLHKADRGDEEAARRLTNTLILCSAFIDISTQNFYAFKMSTRPIFTSHINRINTTFSAISLGQTSILSDLRSSGEDKDGFLNKLLDALKDCLNSPCNLFAQSSDSVASLAKVANTQNINAIPSFKEIKDQFTHTFEGVDHTLFKKLPKTIKSNVIKMGQLCQKAWGESMDMFFEKDKDAKQKIIEKAQSGEALDFEDEGFRYIPDLENYLNADKMASNILSKVASDLGGCFDGFQQSYRYDPYSADYNLAKTSNEPTKNKVNDIEFKQNLLGQAETKGKRDLSVYSVSNPKVSAEESKNPADRPKEECKQGEVGDGKSEESKIKSGSTPSSKLQKGGNPSIYPFWDSLNSKFSGLTNLGIWGDAAHQARKSDHNTGDALDVGVSNSTQGKQVYQDIINNASSNNVKYIIHQGKIWSPEKGERSYSGSNPHNGHVHVSFDR